MKTLLYILFCWMLIVPAFAQDEVVDEDQIEQLDPKAKDKIKAAHAAYITERLGLTSDEAEKFWPIYREYFQKRKETRQQLREARKTGKSDQELIDLDLKIKQQEVDLEKDYSGRLQKIITPQKLMNLRQAEKDFRRLLIRQIQQRQQQHQRRQEMRDRSQQRLQQRNN
jgi:hypothetical protein